jgi:integrase
LRYLTQEEIRRFINAAQGRFRDLAKAAIYSGCRLSELTRLRVGDLDRASGTIFIGRSKSGRARHVILTTEAQQFFSVLAAGKPADALLLTQDSGRAWGRADHVPWTAGALAGARIAGASFHCLRHTAASQMVMAGVPLNVVAQNLGHSDTRMTEKHYAHLSPSYVAETIRRHTPTYGLMNEDSNVVSL